MVNKRQPGKHLKDRIKQKKNIFIHRSKPKPDVSKRQQIPSVFINIRRSLKIIKNNKKPITSITLIYGLLYFLFVRVLTNVDISELRDSVMNTFGGGESTFFTDIVTVGSIFGRSTSLDDRTGLVYAIISTITSLAFIWIMRKIWLGSKVTVKQAYYDGMYPLVPFTLIVMVAIIQSLPFSIGSFFFQLAINNSLSIGIIEKLFIVSMLVGSFLLSGYLIIGSVMALYAVTVPRVKPLEALRTSKQLLKGRRFAVLRQSLIFLIISGLVAVLIVLGVIWLIPSLAIIAVAMMVVIALPWVHLFFYGLYRDLIDE